MIIYLALGSPPPAPPRKIPAPNPALHRPALPARRILDPRKGRIPISHQRFASMTTTNADPVPPIDAPIHAWTRFRFLDLAPPKTRDDGFADRSSGPDRRRDQDRRARLAGTCRCPGHGKFRLVPFGRWRSRPASSGRRIAVPTPGRRHVASIAGAIRFRKQMIGPTPDGRQRACLASAVH